MSAARKRQILELLAAMEERGHHVKGARLDADGSVTLLTDVPADALALNDNRDWVSLAGKTEISRA